MLRWAAQLCIIVNTMIKENDLIKVKVLKVSEGFALVDYRGKQGTLMQTEITYDAWPTKVDDYVKVGDEIIVRVIAVDGKKFSPSLKQIGKNPWEDPPVLGDIYSAPVVFVTDYGFFVRITNYCNALLLTENSFENHEVGDVVAVQITNVDTLREKVLLKEVQKGYNKLLNQIGAKNAPPG